MDVQKKIAELIEEKAFAEALANAATAEEVVELFGKNGVEVPMEIAAELFQDSSESDELSEEDLGEVAGGGIIRTGVQAVFYVGGYLGARLSGRDKKEAKKNANKWGKVGNVMGGAMETILFR